MMVGRPGWTMVLVILGLPQQHQGSLLVHPPGLNPLDQSEEVFLILWIRNQHVVQFWEGASLVLHPVRLQTHR